MAFAMFVSIHPPGGPGARAAEIWFARTFFAHENDRSEIGPSILQNGVRRHADRLGDARRLVRAVVLSRGYQLAPWAGPNAPPPEAFAAAAEKPLTAEAIARSARIASGRSPDDDALRRAGVDRFPDWLPRGPRATIQQAMFLANGETVAALFKPEPGTAAIRLGALPAVEDRVREAFRLVSPDLTRRWGVEVAAPRPDATVDVRKAWARPSRQSNAGWERAARMTAASCRECVFCRAQVEDLCAVQADALPR